MVSLH